VYLAAIVRATHSAHCNSSTVVTLCRDNVTKDYVLRVGQVREIKLVILVTNTGEEAHEAMVYIDMPPSLEYRGTDERVSVETLQLYGVVLFYLL